jgi:ribulose-bisphosphate carboxylase large chain
LKLSDQKAFFAENYSLNMDDYLQLDYIFETVADPHLAAAQLCQEMSTIQWHRLGVDEDFRPRFGAKVLSLTTEKIPHSSSSYLQAMLKHDASDIHRCQVTIAYPYHNFGTRIPNLLTIAAGEGAFHAPDIITIRWTDIHFPQSFLSAFQGPQFGISGLRELMDIHGRPIIFGVIKPNIGLTPEAAANIAFEAWCGGLDVAIDDEQMSDADWSPLAKRAEALTNARKRAEDKTGERKMYLANITDEVDQILPLHDIAMQNGANAVMLNVMTVGISAVRMLRKHAAVPIMSHFDLFGTMTQVPYHGIQEKVFSKLQRLAGVDALIYPGLSPRMKTTEEDVHATVDTGLAEMGTIKEMLPIPGGSQWAGSLETLYQAFGHADFGVIPGRAVFDHPMGPRGGAASMRQGWEAIQRGIPIKQYAQQHRELREAIQYQQK